MNSEPLHIVATLAESVVFRQPPMLDGILARMRAELDGSRAFGDPSLWPEIPIPIEKHHSNAFWLCSSGFCRVEQSDVHHKHRRAPWREYAVFGNASITRVNVSAAEDKSYRVEYSRKLLVDDKIEWWCIGDAEQIRNLLVWCDYLAKYRGSGKGRLRQPGGWIVESCEPWGDGFPIIRDGKPMRPMPIGTPGLTGKFRHGFSTVRPPYWHHAAEALVAVPDQ